jgi:hypothetical protein
VALAFRTSPYPMLRIFHCFDKPHSFQLEDYDLWSAFGSIRLYVGCDWMNRGAGY